MLWFDAELMAGIGFSNAPGAPPLVYGQGYFPLEDAVALTPGDRLAVRLRANLVEEYAVERATVERDLEALLGELVAHDLVARDTG